MPHSQGLGTGNAGAWQKPVGADGSSLAQSARGIHLQIDRTRLTHQPQAVIIGSTGQEVQPW